MVNDHLPNLIMAQSMAEGLAKLQLDPETGEMVSKNELKKRLQKRAKKAAAQLVSKKATKESSSSPSSSVDNSSHLDPNAMFKQGFLADVFKERPLEGRNRDEISPGAQLCI